MRETCITCCFTKKKRLLRTLVCKKLVFAADWSYIGTILVCPKSKMTNRFMTAHVRPNLAQSIETKCESRTFVYFLAAEDVGGFPDGNATEAFSVLVA